jgi:hypothetical protein
MRDTATAAARTIASAARIDAVRDGVEAAAPVVRRLAADKRMRAALRDIVDAGREVAEEIQRDGAGRIARDMVREDRLAGELETSARALQGVAGKLSRARAKVRRRRIMRIVGSMAAVGSVSYAAWRAIQGRGCARGASENGAGRNGAMHAGPAVGDAGATARASGAPAPGS